MGNIRMIAAFPIAVTAARSRLQLAATVRNVSASIILTPRRWSATTSGSAFAGASMSSERQEKSDPKNKSDGTGYGAKAVLELWLNMGAEAWTSVDFSYEKNIESGEGEWNGRAGLFAGYEWNGGEVSLAGGVSERIGDWASEDVSPYGSLNVLFQH